MRRIYNTVDDLKLKAVVLTMENVQTIAIVGNTWGPIS